MKTPCALLILGLEDAVRIAAKNGLSHDGSFRWASGFWFVVAGEDADVEACVQAGKLFGRLCNARPHAPGTWTAARRAGDGRKTFLALTFRGSRLQWRGRSRCRAYL